MQLLLLLLWNDFWVISILNRFPKRNKTKPVWKPMAVAAFVTKRLGL